MVAPPDTDTCSTIGCIGGWDKPADAWPPAKYRVQNVAAAAASKVSSAAMDTTYRACADLRCMTASKMPSKNAISVPCHSEWSSVQPMASVKVGGRMRNMVSKGFLWWLDKVKSGLRKGGYLFGCIRSINCWILASSSADDLWLPNACITSFMAEPRNAVSMNLFSNVCCMASSGTAAV